MPGVTGSININTTFNQPITGIPGSSVPSISNQQSIKVQFSNTSGSGANQVNLKHSKTYVLAAAPLDLDLTSLTDVVGNAVTFAKIRSISVVNKSTTDGQVVVVGYATTTSNAWTGLLSNPGTITIEPSTTSNAGAWIQTAPNTTGWAVSSSSKLIQLDPGANTITVDVEIVGA
jgi:hypothetical protein